MIATLDQLDKEALIRILTEPRNALVKQYQKLFELDGVTLEFADHSLECIAEEAIKRDTGARGLRAILEENLIDVMFDLPSKENIEKCMITKEVIINKDKPILVLSLIHI